VLPPLAVALGVYVKPAEEAQQAVEDGQGVGRATRDVEVHGDVRGHPVVGPDRGRSWLVVLLDEGSRSGDPEAWQGERRGFGARRVDGRVDGPIPLTGGRLDVENAYLTPPALRHGLETASGRSLLF
jgi:hypothetical protein